jgi:aldehyde dehydrogenase (NAD+)
VTGAPGIYVGGAWRPAASTLEARNPARPAEVVGTYAEASAQDVRDACAAAAEAAKTWGRTSAIERGNLLYRMAAVLERRAEEIATDLTREEGKTIGESRGELARAIAVTRYFAGEAAQPLGEVYPSAAAERFLYTVREPLGVVGVITPWNFPVAIPVWKMAPALAFGNTVVWKPSVLTPTCAVRVIEVFEEAGFPPGVVNLVIGGRNPVGAELVAAPELNAISFTGSNGVGRSIQRDVVERGVKVQLELGGKNPAIVLADADLELATRETLRGAMMSTGQKCTATSRAIVVGDALEPFLDRLVPRVAALRVGDPLLPETEIGPLASRGQYDTVLRYLDVAREEGHTLLTGGEPVDVDGGAGYFVAPTIYGDVGQESRIATEEIFGPVLGIQHVDSLADAIELANAVEYGLSASLFTRDLGQAMTFVRGIEAGIVHVNSETAGSEPQVPFGGMKASSSHSREQGKTARDFFTEVKTVYIDLPAAA